MWGFSEVHEDAKACLLYQSELIIVLGHRVSLIALEDLTNKKMNLRAVQVSSSFLKRCVFLNFPQLLIGWHEHQIHRITRALTWAAEF